jgi:tRNA G46 methylase TrmB
MENSSRKTASSSADPAWKPARRGTREILGLIWSNFRMYGLRDTARNALVHLPSRLEEDDFDRVHGTVVQSLTTDPRILKYIFGHLPIDPREFELIDFGCGKGRAMLRASDFPFRKFTGVEWSKALCQAAQRNPQTYRSKTQ